MNLLSVLAAAAAIATTFAIGASSYTNSAQFATNVTRMGEAKRSLLNELAHTRANVRSGGDLLDNLARISSGDPSKHTAPLPDLNNSDIYLRLFARKNFSDLDILSKPGRLTVVARAYNLNSAGQSRELITGTSVVSEVDYIRLEGTLDYNSPGEPLKQYRYVAVVSR